MQQHQLMIKTTRSQRNTGNPLRSYEDPPPRTPLPLHPPYPSPSREPIASLKELARDTRGL